MGLIGGGAIVVLSDMAKAGFHDVWHSHEHLPERIAIPGFLRARRCVTRQRGVARNLVLYELDDIAVATSAPYLERLNNPTPLTRQSMTSVRSSARSLCRPAFSFGHGVAPHAAAILLSPRQGQRRKLRAWLRAVAMRAAVGSPGLVSIALLERDEAVVRPGTFEESLRPRRDDAIDWLLFVDGYDRRAVRDFCADRLSDAKLRRAGAVAGARTGHYQVAHTIIKADLAPAG